MKRVLPHIAALVTVLVWGVTFVNTKVLLQYLSPLDILIGRMVLGFLALCLIRPRMLRVQRPAHHGLFALAGLLGVFLYFLAENSALQFTDASFASVAVATAPLFTAALGFILLRDQGFGPRFVAGFAIAISGVVLISFQEGPAHVTPLGVVLCLAAALSWAGYSVIVKHLANLGYETIAVTKRVFAWGLLYMAVARLAAGEPVPTAAFGEPQVWANLAFLGLAASAGCFVSWGYTVKQLGTARASAYIYLQPSITVVAAVLVLGEPLTWSIVVGIVLVMVGLVISEHGGPRPPVRGEDS